MEQIIYSISKTDINEVALESFGKTLTQEQMNYIKDSIGDRIAWFEIIENILNEMNLDE